MPCFNYRKEVSMNDTEIPQSQTTGQPKMVGNGMHGAASPSRRRDEPKLVEPHDKVHGNQVCLVLIIVKISK